MKSTSLVLLLLGVLGASVGAHSNEKIEMDTTYVKGNKELPKILFVVPWQDLKPGKHEEQTLVIHSLYGDLFDPVVPRESPDPKSRKAGDVP